VSSEAATESEGTPGSNSANERSFGAPVLDGQRTAGSGGGSRNELAAGSGSSEDGVTSRVHVQAVSEPIAMSAPAPAEAATLALPAAAKLETPLLSAALDGIVGGSRIKIVSTSSTTPSAMPSSDAPPAERLKDMTTVAGVVRVTGIMMLTGAVSWATQATGLVGALVAGAPAWRHVDPLFVLGTEEEPTRKKQDEGDEALGEEDAVANLWGADTERQNPGSLG
jgi:hypothetical protein